MNFIFFQKPLPLRFLKQHNQYIRRCLKIAQQGMGSVSPNPMVGAVLVYNDKIIKEGYHKQYGKAHAEVNAITGVDDKVLSNCILYVSLEPCAHYGITPPCAQLIIDKKIPKVVISCTDIFEKVSGKGIKMLQNAGVDVTVGILEKEGQLLNKRFNTFHLQKRPYIILKWAETKDGFIKGNKESQRQISGIIAQKLNHQWRAFEDAIVIGKNTYLEDNPRLTTRLVKGKNPKKYILGSNIMYDIESNVFAQGQTTVIGNKKWEKGLHKGVDIPNYKNLTKLLDILYKDNIQSAIIEGGARLINAFLQADLYDEIRVFKSKDIVFGNGIQSPNFDLSLATEFKNLLTDFLYLYTKK